MNTCACHSKAFSHCSVWWHRPTKTAPGKCFNEKKTKIKKTKANPNPTQAEKRLSMKKEANSQQQRYEKKETKKTHADLEQQRKPTNHGKYDK